VAARERYGIALIYMLSGRGARRRHAACQLPLIRVGQAGRGGGGMAGRAARMSGGSARRVMLKVLERKGSGVGRQPRSTNGK